jgi:hypothetical protein
MALALALGLTLILCAPAWHDGGGHCRAEAHPSPFRPTSGDDVQVRTTTQADPLNACAVCLSQRILSQSGILGSTDLATVVPGETLSPDASPAPIEQCSREPQARAPPSC